MNALTPKARPLIGLEVPAEPGTKVRVVPSPFDSAPDYVGLTGTIEKMVTRWERTEDPAKGWRTQYRVTMDTTEDNMRVLSNPPVATFGPLWPAEGPYSFIMLDHELEAI